MSKRALILTVVGWIILTLFNYYYMNFFVLAFVLLGLILTLFIISFVQIFRLIKERKNLSKLRIQNAFVFLTLFLLTLFISKTNRLIEKADWVIFQNTRTEIVEKVRNNELQPNVSWNSWVCELPFDFPVVSNGGNDIGIFRNKTTDKLTVTFWVFRNFFDSPSTELIYTEDPKQIKIIEEKITRNPQENWKIKDNWYRTYGY